MGLTDQSIAAAYPEHDYKAVKTTAIC